MAETRTAAQMARLAAQWRKSGESGASFARRHRMPTWAFWYWCGKLVADPAKAPAAAPRFKSNSRHREARRRLAGESRGACRGGIGGRPGHPGHGRPLETPRDADRGADRHGRAARPRRHVGARTHHAQGRDRRARRRVQPDGGRPSAGRGAAPPHAWRRGARAAHAAHQRALPARGD